MPTSVRPAAFALAVMLWFGRETSAQAQPSPPPDNTGQPAPTPGDPVPPAPVPPAPVAPAPAPDAEVRPPPAPPADPRPTAAAKPDPVAARGIEWTSLRLLRDKGVISEAEYTSALKDLGALVGAGESTTLVVSKLSATLYGYVEGNFNYNSTQSCQEFCGNLQIQKRGTYRGEHGRTIFSPRNSRIGIRVAAPEDHGIRASGVIETDFLGPTATTEQGQWSNPVLRIRQSYVKLETPVVDLLLGQTWSLFGQQPSYLALSVLRPGLPGQLFERTPQIRISKTLRYSPITVELAVAANRPPQQDSATPEGVAGIRVLINRWTGLHAGSLSSAVALQPASLAISGDLRKFRIAEFATDQHSGHVRVGGGVAFNAYLPIVPATKQSKGNALSLTGELAIGSGTSDMYLSLGAAGTRNAAIPSSTAPAGVVYTPNFDPGLAAYDATGHLELIRWTSYIVGVDYYPPGLEGRLGIVVDYGHMKSSNSKKFGGAAVMDPVLGATRESEYMAELGCFFDPTRATRLAASGGMFNDHYVDGTDARNYTVNFNGWLFF